MFTKIVELYKEWKQKRFFKKHGVENWEEYNIKYDPDFDYGGYAISEMFHGYPNVMLIPNPTLVADMFGPCIYSAPIIDWCKENCKGKYRVQIVSVIVDEHGKFIYSGKYGEDELFVSFKNEDDAMLFLLTYDGPEINVKGKFDVVTIR